MVDRLIIDLETLRNQMYRLDEDAQARITELKELVAEANELGMKDAADIFNGQLEEIERVIKGVRGDLSELSKNKEKMIEEIENERRKKLIESKMKTISNDVDKLKAEFVESRVKLMEIVNEEIENKLELE
jgi:hypothetical protein